ncbi:hypothetical protein BDP81DRAFT_186147 [Colletotrichum phormii]|uniref:Uncharacterized protein n=1 Tax=Colletotrichum phormii TaxID=359342 RepID=A0AAJ0EKF2_9PEZI|nr:uncharacterized protein BDP81DRAFT_186147 [Colletotrichum phormii]KAK1639971.1 hypothetical protein BDP81DRAFT_186147 [Colletotrichum phormii]
MGRNSPPIFATYELQQIFFFTLVVIILHSLGPGRAHGGQITFVVDVMVSPSLSSSNPMIRQEKRCGRAWQGLIGTGNFSIFFLPWWYGVPGMTKEKHHQRHIVIVCKIEDHIFVPSTHHFSLCVCLPISPPGVTPSRLTLPLPSDLATHPSYEPKLSIGCSLGRWVQMQNMTDVAGYRKGGEEPTSTKCSISVKFCEMCRVIEGGFQPV